MLLISLTLAILLVDDPKKMRITRWIWRTLLGIHSKGIIQKHLWKTHGNVNVKMKNLTWFGSSLVIAISVNTNLKLFWRIKKHLWRKYVLNRLLKVLISAESQYQIWFILIQDVPQEHQIPNRAYIWLWYRMFQNNPQETFITLFKGFYILFGNLVPSFTFV